MAEYPEHEKLRLIKDKSQTCGDFYEWLQDHGYALAERHSHTDECYDGSYLHCGMSEGDLFRALLSRDQLLAMFFEIDLDKLERREAGDDRRTEGRSVTYPEKIATDLARVVGAQPGSVIFHGIVGALHEVIDRCEKAAGITPGSAEQMFHIRALKTKQEKE